MTILDEILAVKQDEVRNLASKVSQADLASRIDIDDKPRSLLAGMRQAGSFHFICEVKKASPSRGIIQPDFKPVRQAKLYQQGGAAAVSVLTDEKYFMGSLDYLSQVRKDITLPVLRKDFIIDALQVYQARLAGADLILLIARILAKHKLAELAELARSLGMEILLEIAGREEIDLLPADLSGIILGINNRNLHTFEVSLETSLNLKNHLPNQVPVISESGIRSGNDCRRLAENGFSGVLIGETLMKSGDPAAELQKMRESLIV